MSEPTKLKFLGNSSDGRTNRWEATCPVCGKTILPSTTMLRWMNTQCPRPRCQAELFIDFHTQTVKVSR